MEIQRLPVLRDNYVFVLVDRACGQAAVVDPAVAEPVIAALEEQQLQLSVMLPVVWCTLTSCVAIDGAVD